MVQLLVDRGAKLDVKNKRDVTPLGMATSSQARGPLGFFALTLDERNSPPTCCGVSEPLSKERSA